MIKTLKIEETIDTPLVEMDHEKGALKISGRSLPEDAVRFYAPVKEWMLVYISNPNPVTEFVFEMDYYNSASAKQFIIILTLLERIVNAGKELKVIWYFNKEDEVMMDKGGEIQAMASVPFELRSY